MRCQISGGFFYYDQFKIGNIADSIQSVLDKQGEKKPKDEYYFGDDDTYYTYPIEIQNRFKEAIHILKLAEIYAHRIDYLLESDDGEETFLKRLAEEIKEHNEKNKTNN